MRIKKLLQAAVVLGVGSLAPPSFADEVAQEHQKNHQTCLDQVAPRGVDGNRIYGATFGQIKNHGTPGIYLAKEYAKCRLGKKKMDAYLDGHLTISKDITAAMSNICYKGSFHPLPDLSKALCDASFPPKLENKDFPMCDSLKAQPNENERSCRL